MSSKAGTDSKAGNLTGTQRRPRATVGSTSPAVVQVRRSNEPRPIHQDPRNRRTPGAEEDDEISV